MIVKVYEDSQKLGWVVYCPCHGEDYYATKAQARKAAAKHQRKVNEMTQPYGQSGVGTAATPDLEQETNLRVLDRDGRVCLVCGGDGIFSVDGETTVAVVRRDPDWRHVPENLFTACDVHAMLQGSADALASGHSFRVRTGDPVDAVPFLTHAGYRWLTHSGELVDKRPRTR